MRPPFAFGPDDDALVEEPLRLQLEAGQRAIVGPPHPEPQPFVRAGQPLVQLDDTLLRAQIDQQSALADQQRFQAERAEAEADDFFFALNDKIARAVNTGTPLDLSSKTAA